MAKGWASKSVESQIESAEEAKQTAKIEGIDLEQAAWMREKENLLLSRVRVLHELETARNPRYQLILRKGLADLETKIAQFGQNDSPRARSS